MACLLRCLREHARVGELHRTLATLYAAFSERLETSDLEEARALLGVTPAS